eukprot:103608_1
MENWASSHLWTLLPSIICIPISIYGNVKLYHYYRNQMFVQKRSLSTVFGLNISIIYAMFAGAFAKIALNFAQSIPAMRFGVCMYFLAWWLFLFFIITKNWMIFFRYKWTYYTLESEWQQLINPNTVKIKNENNWFIRNNTKYGNLVYMYKLLGSLHCIGFLLCSVGVILRTANLYAEFLIIGALFIFLSLLPPIICYVFIVCKTPAFQDAFYIHSESKLHSKLLILLAVTYIAMNTILSVSHSYQLT